MCQGQIRREIRLANTRKCARRQHEHTTETEIDNMRHREPGTEASLFVYEAIKSRQLPRLEFSFRFV